MFYSHHLLARKAPLGQIWMAATLHAKINRRKLDKLDIIKICEQILNPTVPMALRLSGILMGGVVIVYERKVKLLYDDVSRLLVEINEAWKVKSTVDPTVLPKGKAQAKFEAVTLPSIVEVETEQTMHFSDASFATTRLQRMRLDDLDEQFINISIGDEDPNQQHHHQAEAANITLVDDFRSTLGETDLFNRFERFDIDGDEEIQINFTPQEQPTLVLSASHEDVQLQPPMSRVSCPPTQHEQTQADKQPVEDEEDNLQPEPHKHRSEEPENDEQKLQPSRKRKARRPHPRVIMDNEQIMIPGTIYQLWLQDASSIVSKRGRRTNKSLNPIFNTKIEILMDMPPVALINGLQSFSGELYYPAPLLELWRKCTQAIPACSSSSGGISRDAQTTPSHSPPEELCHHKIIPDFPPGDFQSEAGSQPLAPSVEKFMPEQQNMDPPSMFNDAMPDNQFDFPLSPAGQSSKSAPSSGSGHTLFPSPEEILLTSTRDKKRNYSSAISKLGNLAPVEEEGLLEQDVRSFKIPRHGTIPDSDLLEETGPTQTPHPAISDLSVDRVTQSIREHLKAHFDTPGGPQSETVEQLAITMNRKRAAKFFYQTCVLATLDFVKVHQEEPYGDILICRGPRM